MSSPETIQSSGSAQTPQTVASSSDPRTAYTISSESEQRHYALVIEEISDADGGEEEDAETVQHISSSEDELEVQVLEAKAATARARREEAEAQERLAEAAARRSRAGSARASVQSISSARFSRSSEPQPAQQVPAQAATAHVQVSQPVLPVHPDLRAHVQHAQHVTDSRDAQPVRPNWLDWFGTHAPVPTQHVHDGTNAVEPGGSAGVSAGPPGSGGDGQFFTHALHHARKQASDDGRGVRTLLNERDWELHSVQARVLELEALLAQQAGQRARAAQASPASFATAATAHAAPAYIHTEARVHVATEPASYHGSQREERSLLSGAPPGLPPSAPSTPSSSEDEDDKKKKGGSTPPSSSSSSDGERKKKKKRGKKKKKEPYAMKASTLQLQPHPTALGLPAWKRAMRTCVIASCSRPEKARDFLFEVESESATFESLACDDSARTRTIDARLAEALMRIIKGDLARRLAVQSEAAAMQGTLLSGRQILYLLYRDFARDTHQSDAQNYGHLEKLKCGKELRMLDTFLTCWDNLMLQFGNPPKPDHMYQAFLMKVRDIPELADALLLQKRLPWGDEKKTYEELRRACEQVLEESKQERHRKQLDSLYDTGNVSTALAATPEEKAKMPCFYVRDGKPCPNGKSCAYSHNPAVIEKAKKAKAEKDAKGKGKGKAGKGKDPKGKGKGKVCPFYNSAKGCMHGSQCRYLHEAPAVAAHVAEANTAEPAPKAKAKAAAEPKAAAAEQKPKA